MIKIQSMRKEFTCCLLTGVLMDVKEVIQKPTLGVAFLAKHSLLRGGIL
jgi:hypothetical protein